MIFVARRPGIVPPEVMAKSDSAWDRLVKRNDETFVYDKTYSTLMRGFKAPLRLLFNRKCAYCESSLELGTGDIEQFRPKRVYWWLAYEWDNALIICKTCKMAKANRFPIAGKPAKPFARGDELLSEVPWLLDPCRDHPEEHLAFQETGVIVGLSERGLATVDVLQLNRYPLTEARRKIIQRALYFSELTFSSIIDKRQYLALVSQLLHPSQEFAAATRQFLRTSADKLSKISLHGELARQVRELPNDIPLPSPERMREAEKKAIQLKEAQRSYSIELPAKAHADLYKRSLKRIERIEFHNFRSFDSLQIEMPQITGDYETWLMLIGENALGKTSILQGLALALMGEKRANAQRLDARRCVRQAKGIKSGYVNVVVTGVGDITLSFDLASRRFSVEPKDPKIPLLGYGATRLLPRQLGRKASRDIHIRVDNLFNPTVPLSDANLWLGLQSRKLPKAFEEIREAFSKLVPGGAALKVNKGSIALSTSHGECMLHELSAGYEAMLALIVDIAIGTSGQWTTIGEAEGMVLLDEIEAHLHPQWRMAVVEGLRKAFPRLAFVATTHDPLCLKGLDPGEIVVLRRNEDNSVVAEAHMPSVHDLAADDILTSELFGLPSARNEASPIAIARLSTLLAQRSRTASEERELSTLRDSIAAQFSSALTPMQQEVEKVMTTALKKIQTRPLSEDTIAEIRRQVLTLRNRPSKRAEATVE